MEFYNLEDKGAGFWDDEPPSSHTFTPEQEMQVAAAGAALLQETAVTSIPLTEEATQAPTEQLLAQQLARLEESVPKTTDAASLVNEIETLRREQQQMAVARDGNAYDGNPPYSTAEEQERWIYLFGVFDQYYGNTHQNRAGQWLQYLYISHFTENINYDRTQPPNFNSVYAHIICLDDITYFNQFLSLSVNADRMAHRHSASQVVSTISSLQGGIEAFTNESDAIGDVVVAGVAAMDSIAQVEWPGATGAEMQERYTLLREAFMDSYPSASNSTELIENMNDNLSEYAGLENLADAYVDLAKVSIVNVLTTGYLGIVTGALEATLNIAVTSYYVSGLASLYSSYSFRRAGRLCIIYGLDPLP